MSLVIEDGTGKSDSQSYLGVTDADAYFTIRGIAAWTGENAEKESALIAATEYIDIRWGNRLKGDLQFPDTQALLFPRLSIYDAQGRLLTGIPERLKRATAEYALISLTQELMPNIIVADEDKVLVEESEETGPVKETKKYQIRTNSGSSFSKADMLMSVFAFGSGQATAYV